MRLCLIANPNLIHTHRWVDYFVNCDYDVHLIGEKLLKDRAPDNVTFYDLATRTNIRKVRYLAWAKEVRHLIRTLHPDVLHAHQITSAGWLGAVAGYHPFMVTSWGSDLLINARRSRSQRLLARWVLRRADFVTCVSHNLADAARVLGADPARLQVTPWGVDTKIYHSADADERTTLRARLGLGPGPIILSIRAMRSIYNPLILAEAMPQILDVIPAAQFVVRTYNNDAALFERFQQIVQQNDVDQTIHYVGDLPSETDVADLYRIADVAVSIPASDGTPSSVYEALACGAVPVLSDLPSLHEWIMPEQEALFVAAGDSEQLSAAILRLLTDVPLHTKLRDKGMKLVHDQLDRSVRMAHCREIYEMLAAGGPAA